MEKFITSVTATESFLLHPLLKWEVTLQNNHQSVSGVCRRTGTKTFLVEKEKYRSTAAASAVSAACSMLAVRRHHPVEKFHQDIAYQN